MTQDFFDKLSPTGALSGSNLLRTLVETMRHAVYVKDAWGRYVLNNETHAKSLGIPGLEEIGRKSDFDFYPEEPARRYRADEQEIIRSGHPLVSKKCPSVDGEGNQRWLSIVKVPLRDSNGQIVGLLSIARDATEEREAEETLRSSEASSARWCITPRR